MTLDLIPCSQMGTVTVARSRYEHCESSVPHNTSLSSVRSTDYIYSALASRFFLQSNDANLTAEKLAGAPNSRPIPIEEQRHIA